MAIKKFNYYSIVAHISLLIFQYIFWEFTIDEAFISFRYAQNLVNYQQMVFNINDIPIEGYSSFLWILWISLSFIINIDLLLFSKLSGILFSHISIYVLYKISILINSNKSFGNIIIIFYVFLNLNLVFCQKLGGFNSFFPALNFFFSLRSRDLRVKSSFCLTRKHI